MAYNSQKDTFWLIHDTLYSNGFPRNHPILLQSIRCFHVDALTHVSSKLYGRRDYNYGVLRAAAVGSPTEADLPLPSGETNGQGGPGNDLLQRLAQIPDDAVIGAGLSVWTTTPYEGHALRLAGHRMDRDQKRAGLGDFRLSRAGIHPRPVDSRQHEAVVQ
ncbi:hypothetical protein NHJ6243_008399 [Beauveria neobassiana]